MHDRLTGIFIDQELAWTMWLIGLVIQMLLLGRIFQLAGWRELQLLAGDLRRRYPCRWPYATLFQVVTYEAPDCQHWLLPRYEGQTIGFVLRALADLSESQLRIAHGQYYFRS